MSVNAGRHYRVIGPRPDIRARISRSRTLYFVLFPAGEEQKLGIMNDSARATAVT